MARESEREVRGTIHIILDRNPGKTPEVRIDGEWTHRQVMSLPQFINKAFRSYVMNKRKSLIREIESDE